MARTILAFSGGLASTALLWDLLQRKVNVSCVTVDYGQTNRPELSAAEDMCKALNVQHIRIGIALGDSPRKAPMAGYALLVLSIAASIAELSRADTVASGHSLDRAHREMTFALNHCVQLEHEGRVGLYSPYHDRDFEWIIRSLKRSKVPWELTWSCQRNERRHCGECKGCQRRQRGFRCAGVPDPTAYAQTDPVYLPFLRGDV